jgi:hypothetical protein
MRVKKAKALRQQVYGEKTFRARKYFVDDKGTIHADFYRKTYQHLKKNS